MYICTYIHTHRGGEQSLGTNGVTSWSFHFKAVCVCVCVCVHAYLDADIKIILVFLIIGRKTSWPTNSGQGQDV